jgi:hypothetical protein
MICFASCTEETTTPSTSGGSSSTSGGVVGVWNFAGLTQENGRVTWDGEVVSTYTSTSSNENGTSDFRSDGTYISKIGYDYQTIQVINGEESSDNATVSPLTTLGEYSYDSNTNELTTTTNGSTFVSKVTELTANKMVVVLDVSVTNEVNGITVVSSNTTTTTYTK